MVGKRDDVAPCVDSGALARTSRAAPPTTPGGSNRQDLEGGNSCDFEGGISYDPAGGGIGEFTGDNSCDVKGVNSLEGVTPTHTTDPLVRPLLFQ